MTRQQTKKAKAKKSIALLRNNGKRLPNGDLYVNEGVKLLDYRTLEDNRPRNKTMIPLVIN